VSEFETFPSYRARWLPGMTRSRIAALPDKDRAIVVVATGAIEQHGPHLPVAVDALMGQVWTTRALALLPDDVACFVGPPIVVGKSNEHVGFPGTLSISKETLRAQVLAIARQLHAWGFRRLRILNTHGGNTSVLIYTMREVRARFGFDADLLRSDFAPDVSKQEAEFGFHAGEVETSWMLAAANRLVRMSEARACYPARLEDPGELRPEAAPATFAWVTRDLSPTGILGDATAATAAKGERWLQLGAEGYARAIEAAYREGGPAVEPA
jgi:creatinine amidohydrolase